MWTAIAAGCHRVHRTLDANDPAALDVVAAIARACAVSGTALLVEAGSADRDADRATAAAVAAIRVAEGAGLADLQVAVDPGTTPSPYACGRLLAARLADAGLDVPIVAIDRPKDRGADPVLGPASCLGGLLCDGIGDAVQVVADTPDASRRLAFGLLQAARIRITRTEYISCPSCGRTLFDLEETTARIKARTAHLKGLKIGIMGCVVNGPGEMADADFGYVGWGEGRIALFVGKTMVDRDVPESEADERLVRLIREHGAWVDPPAGD
jgi:4-hydroxy-3-methylbut-2-en-1-yl diphosphate synthase IspG/GcpE